MWFSAVNVCAFYEQINDDDDDDDDGMTQN